MEKYQNDFDSIIQIFVLEVKYYNYISLMNKYNLINKAERGK